MGQVPRVMYEYEAPATQPLGEKGDMHFAFSFAAQAAEVQVNTQTGEVTVLRVVAANDVGEAFNPLGLQGQVEGGVMMGIGSCLTEEYIVEAGNVVTDRLARYRVPGIMMTPEITSIVVEHPMSAGPYGAKGVGEICTIPTPPAITNAIYNAVGVRIDTLPVDQEMIARAIRQAQTRDRRDSLRLAKMRSSGALDAPAIGGERPTSPRLGHQATDSGRIAHRMNKFLGYRCSLCGTEYGPADVTYVCPKDEGQSGRGAGFRGSARQVPAGRH